MGRSSEWPSRRSGVIQLASHKDTQKVKPLAQLVKDLTYNNNTGIQLRQKLKGDFARNAHIFDSGYTEKIMDCVSCNSAVLLQH